MSSIDSYKTKSKLTTSGGNRGDIEYFSLKKLEADNFPGISRLPYSIRILLENLLRNEDGYAVKAEDIERLAGWGKDDGTPAELPFFPGRILLQDFTGVPSVADLAAMREAAGDMYGDPLKINPQIPVELVIDHSVQLDECASHEAFDTNLEMEFKRNRERYAFLRWGQKSFQNFKVVPPGAGIVHQVNLEHLARVVFLNDNIAYPDTVVGLDSHTTMINGIGVMGWGVGGIEAEAVMLGRPYYLLTPQVVGFRLEGELPEGTNATDLVLHVTQKLREKGVVGKFVEFFGPGLDSLTLEDRATVANMAPEYGATMGFFPVDELTMTYLKLTGRDAEDVDLIETYLKEQGLFRTSDSPEPEFTDVVSLDMAGIVHSTAGPKRPQDRIALTSMKQSFDEIRKDKKTAKVEGEDFEIGDGSIVIAAITSCTSTSNPFLMIGAGLLAKKGVEKGLKVKPWVRTSFAPGSRVVSAYMEKSGLMPFLEQAGLHIIAYGCAACIGNSGPLPENIVSAIEKNELMAASVLSGNRNFEGRVSPHTTANYLASPALVAAYAFAGRADIDFETEPIGNGSDGTPVFLKDIWPTSKETRAAVEASIAPEMFTKEYSVVFDGPEKWQQLPADESPRYPWDPASTYIKEPPFLQGMSKDAPELKDIASARVLALLGDSVTTDHISPAGAIPVDGAAGKYLIEKGVALSDFNSFGSRRGNHEVMMRGTFGNIRLQNLLVPETSGSVTIHLPTGEQTSIFDASTKYIEENTSLIVIAGKEYGTGSSRDWAAKGTSILGVKGVIAESFERIHRSNLVCMGVLPMQFEDGEGAKSLGLDGTEIYSISGIKDNLAPGTKLMVTAEKSNGTKTEFSVIARIDTQIELEYFRHEGILRFVLRNI